MFSNRLLTVELFSVVCLKYLKFAQNRDWEVDFYFVKMIIMDALFPFLVGVVIFKLFHKTSAGSFDSCIF